MFLVSQRPLSETGAVPRSIVAVCVFPSPGKKLTISSIIVAEFPNEIPNTASASEKEIISQRTSRFLQLPNISTSLFSHLPSDQPVCTYEWICIL